MNKKLIIKLLEITLGDCSSETADEIVKIVIELLKKPTK